ncbi:hypothetical protein NIES22_72120 (plasmid) [Calothrix brevissima NIES-22]|nr:hypothetical protein NIES22_72120 [Calothrix brevissima NIES-22]
MQPFTMTVNDFVPLQPNSSISLVPVAKELYCLEKNFIVNLRTLL